jgi:hypothetical protein
MNAAAGKSSRLRPANPWPTHLNLPVNTVLNFNSMQMSVIGGSRAFTSRPLLPPKKYRQSQRRNCFIEEVLEK